MGKRKTGTKEWSKYSKNFLTGCSNDCIYCYARAMAERFKRVKKGEWKNMELNLKKLCEKPRKLNGRIMFPTTHDITEKYIEENVQYLRGWLGAGNEILIVSKPSLVCIKRICAEFSEYKDKITFRFTIGSNDDEVLGFWEPNAPKFEERFEALKYAFNAGFETSVSCEPFLDGNIEALFHQLKPYVTDTIWIGKMNRVRQRVDMTGWGEQEFRFLSYVENNQSDGCIRFLYTLLGDETKVRWKDSIKKVLGLEEVDAVE